MANIQPKQIPIYVKMLENIFDKQTDPTKKANIKETLTKVKQKIDKFDLDAMKKLNKQARDLFVQLRYQYVFYKRAYEKIITREQFKICATDKIYQFFAFVQEKVKFDNPSSNYTSQMAIKKKAYNWNKQFIDAWNQQKKKIQKDKLQADKQKNQQRQKNIKKIGIDKIHLQTQKQNPPVNNRPGQQSESSQSTPPNQKPKQKKPVTAPKQDTKLIPVLQPKNSVKIMQKYLQQRKDLNIPNNKYKQYAQFINSHLQKFMKYQIAKLIDIAKLRNKPQKDDPYSGNQFSYFSKDNPNIKISNSTQVMSSDVIKLYKVNYRPKLEIYSMLRVKQEILQQKMMKEYQNKKDNDKKSDKRMWDYLLKPKQSQKAESYIEQQEKSSDRLTLDIYHIRYLFQQHPYIKESFLMFSCYNT